MKKTLSLSLILCLLLCSCAPAISNDPTVEPATESATPSQTTAPSIQSTEPPTTELPTTEPPATEPVTELTFPTWNGTPLTDTELAALQPLFQWPGYYATASYSTFSTPSELSLKQLIREGPDAERDVTLTEAEHTQLSAISEGFIHLNTARITKEAAARVLEQYYGLSLEDLAGTDSSVYLASTDSFYYYASDTTACRLVITQAMTLEDGTLWVCYHDELSGLHSGEMLLQPTGDGYQILANKVSW